MPTFAKAQFQASTARTSATLSVLCVMTQSPKRRIFAVAYGCKHVANFLESRQGEVRRRWPCPGPDGLPQRGPCNTSWSGRGDSGDQYRTRPPRKQDRPQEHQQPARDQQQRYPCPLEHGLHQPHRGPLWPRGPLCRLVQGCADLPPDVEYGRAKTGEARPYSTLATEHAKFI